MDQWVSIPLPNLTHQCVCMHFPHGTNQTTCCLHVGVGGYVCSFNHKCCVSVSRFMLFFCCISVLMYIHLTITSREFIHFYFPRGILEEIFPKHIFPSGFPCPVFLKLGDFWVLQSIHLKGGQLENCCSRYLDPMATFKLDISFFGFSKKNAKFDPSGYNF